MPPEIKRLRSILVANRGEIAVRVMRSAKALGYRTVAVYSAADAGAPHVRMADDAVFIGGSAVAESYLDAARIIRASVDSGADAVHPGYGFLSENARFAGACADAGLVFIGPTAQSIELMGNKAAAKRRMMQAGVPCVPGYEGTDQTDAALHAAAHTVGFPLMVKAAAGGGGRGMRLVQTAGELAHAIDGARSEAANAFGSDELILERALVRPRHVEIQVFADTHGNVIHLGERDCSVQRRHQKILEEAPCPVMTDSLRARMGAAAVDAARSIEYRGAGTVEFLLDETNAFYFLEMNTRLQVEHPVTEMITGLDLVELQFRVAEGRPLGLTQEAICLRGHAIEARLYAEDTARDFLPVTGTVELWTPAAGEGVRIDTGIETGSEISPYYDAMLAKVIAWGETRAAANSRLVEALRGTRLFGLTTNKDFLVEMLDTDAFRAGRVTTAFIGEEFGGVPAAATLRPAEAAAAAVLEFVADRERALSATLGIAPELLNWGTPGQLHTRYRYRCDEAGFDLTVTPRGPSVYGVAHDGVATRVEVLARDGAEALLDVDGRRWPVGWLAPEPGVLHVDFGGRAFVLRNMLAVAAVQDAAGAGGQVTAPMHGVLVDVFVGVGDAVVCGARLAVLEAMKMQHELRSPLNGTVRAMHGSAGGQVAAGEVIMEIAPAAAGAGVEPARAGQDTR